MTEKELKRLSRGELLEMLIAETKRSYELEQQLQDAKEQLESRRIDITEAGSIAEASLRLNKVFNAAQFASQQYLENVARLSAEQDTFKDDLLKEAKQKSEALWEDTQKRCGDLETGTLRRCTEMLEWAKKESQSYWDEVYSRLEQYCSAHDELSSAFGRVVPAPPTMSQMRRSAQ